MKIKDHSPLAVYAWLFFFSFIPLLLIIVVSFLSHTETELATLPWSLDAYRELMSPLFLNILWRSLHLATITCGACLVLAYPFSYLVVKSKHRSILLLLIMLPFWTSSLVRTYALLSILKQHGLLNFFLLKSHIITTPQSFLYSPSAVLCGLIYTLFPFMVLPIMAQMERFDFRLIEAARDLGASALRVFFTVFLPNTLQGVASGCLLVFLPAMTLFYIPNILGGARSILLGNLIQNQFMMLDNWPDGAATSVLLTVSLLIILGVIRKL